MEAGNDATVIQQQDAMEAEGGSEAERANQGASDATDGDERVGEAAAGDDVNGGEAAKENGRGGDTGGEKKRSRDDFEKEGEGEESGVEGDGADVAGDAAKSASHNAHVAGHDADMPDSGMAHSASRVKQLKPLEKTEGIDNEKKQEQATFAEDAAAGGQQGDAAVEQKQSEKEIDQKRKEEIANQKRHFKKRKVALYVCYCGAKYQGMQKNPGARTIEEEMEKGLFKAGAISEEDFGDQRKIDWMRAARTDKGVSALGQVVSARLIVDPPGFVDRVNSCLPTDIRVLGFVRVIASFSARGLCDRRKYEYLVPTFAFDPMAHRDRAFLEANNLLIQTTAAVAAEAGSAAPAAAVAAAKQPAAAAEREGGIAVQVADDERMNVADVASGTEALSPNALHDAKESDLTSSMREVEKEENGSSEKGREGALGAQGSHDQDQSTEGQASKNLVHDSKKAFVFGKEEMARLNSLLSKFCGTHHFHNYTVQTHADDPSSIRYIVSFAADEELLEMEGTTFVRCRVVGQSFMLHQIRKMIAMVIAVMRGHAPESMLTDAFRKDKKFKLPMAPELGLFLEECLYPAYNRKWKKTHEEVDLAQVREKVEAFKKDVVYPHIARTERRDHTMAKWLSTLNDRDFPDFAVARAIAQGKLRE